MSQILALPVVLVALLILTAGVGIYMNSFGTRTLIAFKHAKHVSVRRVDQLVDELNHLQIEMLRFGTKAAGADRAEALKRTQDIIQTISTVMAQLQESTRGSKLEADFRRWRLEWDGIHPQCSEVLLRPSIGVGKLEGPLSKLEKEIETTVFRLSLEEDAVINQTVDLSKKADLALWILSLVGVVLGLWSATVIIRRIQFLFEEIAESYKFAEQIELALGTSAMVVVAGADGKVTHANDKFVEITQYSREEVVGRDFFGIQFANGSEDFLGTIHQVLARDDFWMGEIKTTRKDGIEFWMSSTVVPIRDRFGRIIRYIAIQYDISQKKEAELQLSIAREEALTAVQTKSVFLATMSHEIRTPLNGILGMCDLLLDASIDPTQSMRIKLIQNCSSTLISLLSDVLDFSKLEVDKIELECVAYSLNSTTLEVVELFRSTAAEKGLEISYIRDPSTPDRIVGDVTRFRQILSNLLSNAIKFTSRGGITVRSSATCDEGQHYIRFDVQDTGVGVSEEGKAKLFQAFSQVDASTTRKYGGTGLGLAISKGLCEKMGGTIWLESTKRKGSTFSFTFKAAQAESECEKLKDSPSWTSQMNEMRIGDRYPFRILIAEDNQVNQLVLVGLLKRLGYEPEVASNGVEVLGLLEKGSYDLIFMDCFMPEMDGFECTWRIRAQVETAEPRIIGVTASTLKSDLDHCLKSGMDEVLHKPVSATQLAEALLRAAYLKKKPRSLMDLQRFRQRFRGLEDVAAQMIEGFQATAPELLMKIESAARNGDAPSVKIAAHTLKGVLSNFHADSIADDARLLEEQAAQGNLDGALEQSERISSKVRELLDELASVTLKRETA